MIGRRPGGLLVASPCPWCDWPFSAYARKGLDLWGRRVFWLFVCSACKVTGEAAPDKRMYSSRPDVDKSQPRE